MCSCIYIYVFIYVYIYIYVICLCIVTYYKLATAKVDARPAWRSWRDQVSNSLIGDAPQLGAQDLGCDPGRLPANENHSLSGSVLGPWSARSGM